MVNKYFFGIGLVFIFIRFFVEWYFFEGEGVVDLGCGGGGEVGGWVRWGCFRVGGVMGVVGAGADIEGQNWGMSWGWDDWGWTGGGGFAMVVLGWCGWV